MGATDPWSRTAINQLAFVFGGTLINAVGNGLIIGLVSIMIADTIRYGTALGIQAEGILASTDDFGVNVGLGLGGLVTAGLFHLSGYGQSCAKYRHSAYDYPELCVVTIITLRGDVYRINFYNEQQLQDAINV